MCTTKMLHCLGEETTMKQNQFFKRTICIIMLMHFILLHTVSANIEDNEKIDVEQIKNEVIQTSANVSNQPKINSRIALVYDRLSR